MRLYKYVSKKGYDMFGKILKSLFNFNSNLDYYPRFIEKDSYKKNAAKSVSDLDDYKEMKSTIESLSPCARAVYAYAPVRKHR